MIYGYIRVSSDKQTVENQRFEINNFCKKENLQIDGWIEETISGTKAYNKRQLGVLLKRIQKDDLIICAELSRLGRPKGKKNAPEKYKLSGKENLIRELLHVGVSKRQSLLYQLETTQEELHRETVRLARRLRTLLGEGIPLSEIPKRMLSLDDVHSPLTIFNYSNFYYL